MNPWIRGGRGTNLGLQRWVAAAGDTDVEPGVGAQRSCRSKQNPDSLVRSKPTNEENEWSFEFLAFSKSCVTPIDRDGNCCHSRGVDPELADQLISQDLMEDQKVVSRGRPVQSPEKGSFHRRRQLRYVRSHIVDSRDNWRPAPDPRQVEPIRLIGEEFHLGNVEAAA
jgi:hypothetical protein